MKVSIATVKLKPVDACHQNFRFSSKEENMEQNMLQRSDPASNNSCLELFQSVIDAVCDVKAQGNE